MTIPLVCEAEPKNNNIDVRESSMSKKIKVLALDLEGTLISNAVSQVPRPHLYEFLQQVNNLFPRVVMFTAVSKSVFNTIADRLVAEKEAPEWFRSIEYISWDNEKTKKLDLIPDLEPDTYIEADEALLVDDYKGYVHRSQESQWIRIKPVWCKYSNEPYDIVIKEYYG